MFPYMPRGLLCLLFSLVLDQCTTGVYHMYFTFYILISVNMTQKSVNVTVVFSTILM